MRRTYLIACAGRSAQLRAPARRLRPAFQRLVDRLHARLRVAARRQVVDALAVEPVADADLELVEAVEHVELGQRDAVDAADLDGLAHQHGVEPAAAPLAPRDGAELVPALAEPLADLVVELGRERPGADARRVGLGDAEHVADGARAHARARRRLGGDGVGRGDVTDRCRGRRRAARPARPRTGCACRPCARVEQVPRHVHEGQDLGRDLGELRHQPCLGDLGLAQAAAQRVVMREQRSILRPSVAGCAGPARGWRGGRPCPRRPGRCRAPWCRSCWRPPPPRG